MEEIVQNEFVFYSKIVTPLVLNLPKSRDRILAAAWVKKFGDETCGDERLRTIYLKLLLFCLQRRRLTGIFADDPSNYELLEELPQDIDLNDFARNLLEQEKAERRELIRQEMMGDMEPFPAITTDCSTDLTEYVAAQDIPNFGVHAYYAISKQPINRWQRAEYAILPKGTRSSGDTTGTATATAPSCVCTPKGIVSAPEVEGADGADAETLPECRKKKPDQTSSEKKKRRPKKLGASPPSHPIGDVTTVPEVNPTPTWGTNLVEIRDHTDIGRIEEPSDQQKALNEQVARMLEDEDEDDEFDSSSRQKDSVGAKAKDMLLIVDEFKQGKMIKGKKPPPSRLSKLGDRSRIKLPKSIQAPKIAVKGMKKDKQKGEPRGEFGPKPANIPEEFADWTEKDLEEAGLTWADLVPIDENIDEELDRIEQEGVAEIEKEYDDMNFDAMLAEAEAELEQMKSVYDLGIEEDEDIVENFDDEIMDLDDQFNISREMEEFEEDSPALARRIPVTTPQRSPSPKRVKSPEKVFAEEDEFILAHRKSPFSPPKVPIKEPRPSRIPSIKPRTAKDQNITSLFKAAETVAKDYEDIEDALEEQQEEMQEVADFEEMERPFQTQGPGTPCGRRQREQNLSPDREEQMFNTVSPEMDEFLMHERQFQKESDDQPGGRGRFGFFGKSNAGRQTREIERRARDQELALRQGSPQANQIIEEAEEGLDDVEAPDFDQFSPEGPEMLDDVGPPSFYESPRRRTPEIDYATPPDFNELPQTPGGRQPTRRRPQPRQLFGEEQGGTCGDSCPASVQRRGKGQKAPGRRKNIKGKLPDYLYDSPYEPSPSPRTPPEQIYRDPFKTPESYRPTPSPCSPPFQVDERVPCGGGLETPWREYNKLPVRRLFGVARQPSPDERIREPYALSPDPQPILQQGQMYFPPSRGSPVSPAQYVTTPELRRHPLPRDPQRTQMSHRTPFGKGIAPFRDSASAFRPMEPLRETPRAGPSTAVCPSVRKRRQGTLAPIQFRSPRPDPFASPPASSSEVMMRILRHNAELPIEEYPSPPEDLDFDERLMGHADQYIENLRTGQFPRIYRPRTPPALRRTGIPRGPGAPRGAPCAGQRVTRMPTPAARGLGQTGIPFRPSGIARPGRRAIPYPSSATPSSGPSRIGRPAGSGIPCPGSGGFPRGPSGIRRPAGSGIRPPGSGIARPGSQMAAPVSRIGRPAGSGIPCPGAGGIPRGPSGIRPPGSGIRPPGSGIARPPSGIRPPGSQIPGAGSRIGRPAGSGIPCPGGGGGIPRGPSGIRPPGSGIGRPPSGIRPPGSGIPGARAAQPCPSSSATDVIPQPCPAASQLPQPGGSRLQPPRQTRSDPRMMAQPEPGSPDLMEQLRQHQVAYARPNMEIFTGRRARKWARKSRTMFKGFADHPEELVEEEEEEEEEEDFDTEEPDICSSAPTETEDDETEESYPGSPEFPEELPEGTDDDYASDSPQDSPQDICSGPSSDVDEEADDIGIFGQMEQDAEAGIFEQMEQDADAGIFEQMEQQEQEELDEFLQLEQQCLDEAFLEDESSMQSPGSPRTPPRQTSPDGPCIPCEDMDLEGPGLDDSDLMDAIAGYATPEQVITLDDYGLPPYATPPLLDLDEENEPDFPDTPPPITPPLVDDEVFEGYESPCAQLSPGEAGYRSPNAPAYIPKGIDYDPRLTVLDQYYPTSYFDSPTSPRRSPSPPRRSPSPPPRAPSPVAPPPQRQLQYEDFVGTGAVPRQRRTGAAPRQRQQEEESIDQLIYGARPGVCPASQRPPSSGVLTAEEGRRRAKERLRKQRMGEDVYGAPRADPSRRRRPPAEPVPAVTPAEAPQAFLRRGGSRGAALPASQAPSVGGMTAEEGRRRAKERLRAQRMGEDVHAAPARQRRRSPAAVATAAASPGRGGCGGSGRPCGSGQRQPTPDQHELIYGQRPASLPASRAPAVGGMTAEEGRRRALARVRGSRMGENVYAAPARQRRSSPAAPAQAAAPGRGGCGGTGRPCGGGGGGRGVELESLEDFLHGGSPPPDERRPWRTRR